MRNDTTTDKTGGPLIVMTCPHAEEGLCAQCYETAKDHFRAEGRREGIEAAAELAQAWGCCDGYSGGCMHKPIGAGEFARKYGEHRCVREAIRALLGEEAKP